MGKLTKVLALAASLLAAVQAPAAWAGDYAGDFMVRAGVSVVNPDSDATQNWLLAEREQQPAK